MGILILFLFDYTSPKGQVKRHLRRAESPMERVAQGKRSGTLGM